MSTATLIPENNLAATPASDLGNAEHFVAEHGSSLRYCQAKGKWLVWAGDRWLWDDTDRVVALAQKTVRTMLTEALQIDDYEKHRSYATHAIHSEARARIDAMMYLARPHLSVRPKDLDSDRLLFNVANGTLDLRTFKLEPHSPSDLITKLSPIVYDPLAACPNWLRFLEDITAGDAKIVEYLQRAVGYSMTGKTSEHALFMLYGSGCNGKTTFVEALRNVFGEYAKTADFSTFMQQKSSSGPRNDLAMLCGARLVTATESDDGNHLAESFVKQITGGDTVTARFLYGEHFEFDPQFKLWLSTNHKPNIRGTDDGIWRRIRLIPFTVRIADDKIDRSLPDKLKAEASGILSWGVEGLRRYYTQGLNEPNCIKDATAEYRQDEDEIGRFLQARCSMANSARVAARSLYSAFKTWASKNAESVVDERKFAKSMTERGIKSTRLTAGKFWDGINLMPELTM
jgi:putative DNA primase/helicase